MSESHLFPPFRRDCFDLEKIAVQQWSVKNFIQEPRKHTWKLTNLLREYELWRNPSFLKTIQVSAKPHPCLFALLFSSAPSMLLYSVLVKFCPLFFDLSEASILQVGTSRQLPIMFHSVQPVSEDPLEVRRLES